MKCSKCPTKSAKWKCHECGKVLCDVCYCQCNTKKKGK